jgi:hypothetical protein
MKNQPWIVFLRYPYSTIVLACIWIGSAVMVYIDRSLPVMGIVVLDVVAGWVLTWLSFKPGSLK